MSLSKFLMRAVAVYAFTGFVLSLLVHVSTFLPSKFQFLLPGAMLLHIGIFLCIPVLIVAHKLDPAGSPFEGDRKGIRDGIFPSWFDRLLATALIYSLVNFALFAYLTREGQAEFKNGIFCLTQKGIIVRKITSEEYERKVGYTTRGFSGGWMVLYLALTGICWFGLGKKRERTFRWPNSP